MEQEARAEVAPAPPRRPGRPVLVALAVLVLLLVVAVASGARGRGSIEPAPRAIPQALFDYLFTFGVVFFASLLLLALLLHRPGQAPRDDRGLLDYLIAAAGSILTAVAFLYAIRLAVERGLIEGLELNRLERRPGAGVTDPDRPGAPAADFREGSALLLAALVALAAAAHLLRRRSRRSRLGRLAPTVEEELADVLDDTLDDLRAEEDARRAVIAAYARMEAVLAAFGVPRRPAEAPLEYLGRALQDLEVPAGAALDLTALFERAKFSPHPIDAGMKDEAIAALVTVRDALRSAA